MKLDYSFELFFFYHFVYFKSDYVVYVLLNVECLCLTSATFVGCLRVAIIPHLIYLKK